MKTSKFDCRSAAIRCLFGALLLSALGINIGCATWGPASWNSNIWTNLTDHSKNESENPATLQHSSTSLARQSRDALSLSVEFRHVPATLLDETTWSLIDETAIPSGVRKAWLANGMRIGVLTASNPMFADPSETGENQSNGTSQTDPINAFLAGAEVLGKKADGREIIPLRPAHRHELPLSPTLEGENVVLLNRSTGLIGQQFDSPQLVLALKAQRGPRSGQATLNIHPEIHHGAVKQQFISSDTAVRIHAGRERWDLAELNFTWTTRPGTTLLIAPAIEPGAGQLTFGLGNQMLRDDQHLEDDQHLIALVQLTP